MNLLCILANINQLPSYAFTSMSYQLTSHQCMMSNSIVHVYVSVSDLQWILVFVQVDI